MTMHIQYKCNLSKVAEEEYKKTHMYQNEKKKTQHKPTNPQSISFNGPLAQNTLFLQGLSTVCL